MTRFHGHAVAAAVLIFALVSGGSRAAFAAEIDVCQYFVVAEMADDTLLLAGQLRDQGAAHGFEMVSSATDVPAADAFKVCTIAGSWLGSEEVGQLSVRVIDAASGVPIAAADVRTSNRLGFEHMLRSAIAKAFRQFAYAGFNDEEYGTRIRRLYPPPPASKVSESWVKDWQPRGPIEGIWNDAEKIYRLAIVSAPAGMSGSHLAVVIRSASPLWQPGEIKVELSVSDPKEPIAATLYMMNKQPLPATFVLREDGALRGVVNTPAGAKELVLTRE